MSALDRVLIRDARPEDDSTIGDLLVNAFQTQYGAKLPWLTMSEARKADLRQVAQKRSGGRVLVAELEGAVVGTVTLFPPDSSLCRTFVPGAVELRYLATHPRFHGHGLSRPLMDASESWARRVAATAISLHVRRGVEGVARLYARRGYHRAPGGDRQEPPDIELDAYLLPLRATAHVLGVEARATPA